jgi:hypothetical protein
MSTGGTHGRPFGSANRRFTESWNNLIPAGKPSKSAKGEYLITDIMVILLNN